jgi:hypothetical protein
MVDRPVLFATRQRRIVVDAVGHDGALAPPSPESHERTPPVPNLSRSEHRKETRPHFENINLTEVREATCAENMISDLRRLVEVLDCDFANV